MDMDFIALRSWRLQRISELRWRRARRRQASPHINLRVDQNITESSNRVIRLGFAGLIATSLICAVAFPLCLTLAPSFLWRLGLDGILTPIAAAIGVIGPIIGASLIYQTANERKIHIDQQKQFIQVRGAQRTGHGLALAKSVRRQVEKRHKRKNIIFFWPSVIDQLVESDLLDESMARAWRKRNEELRQKWIKREWPDYSDAPSIATRTTDAAGRLVRRVGSDLQR